MHPSHFPEGFEQHNQLILVNQLSFFISHRLPIAEAALAEGFNVVIGYGEVGRADTDPKILEQKGFKIKT